MRHGDLRSAAPGRPISDDAVLLIARTPRPPPRNVASWPLPEDPVAARQARYLRAQLEAWRLGEDRAMTTELIVSERVGNVVRHAKGPVRLRLPRSRTLLREVSDGSPTTPHIRHGSATDEGGRGPHLVAAMVRRWGHPLHARRQVRLDRAADPPLTS
ncbi:ATP-binding protein [Streptomyces sp. NBC_01803]|uniref:ATP-binding protein n=1 Tax=Streptomyces sp. NBC_01803 TaxID=2975946 RepID=UPI002DD9DA8E|nr:ATP-binding protein [Streptomyces sp. NBC_01803]WSA44322.1 ATP-binding protein [Streptomyces sp. NBC_01803]